jgi:hypothetical protein
MTDAMQDSGPVTAPPRAFRGRSAHAGTGPETLRLLLATVWLLDAVLQLQPSMFTPGAGGLGGMLEGVATGNPSWVTGALTWNARIVDHHPVLSNSAFAAVQFLIALGIVWRVTTGAALGVSVVWALAVWFFGEGAGGLLRGAATPFGGGPGAVLFYAVLAVVLRPSDRGTGPFAAARAFGARPARHIWVAVWGALGVLCVVGSGRSASALRALVAGVDSGQPLWLARIDRASESVMAHHGSAAAVLLACLCVTVAAGVYLPPRAARATLVAAIVVFAVIWVAVQDLGGILAGGATDPNSGPLVVLLCLAYWPTAGRPGGAGVPGPAAQGS